MEIACNLFNAYFLAAGAVAAFILAFSASAFAASCSLAILPPCLVNLRVKENSPNLCPTMFSVTTTFTWVLPLCTKKVNPTNSGAILQARDQVLISVLPAWPFNTFFKTLGSTYGPFFADLDII